MGHLGVDDPRSVLFVCTMNVVRSVMAQGILQYLSGSKLRVASAGVHQGMADPYVVAVMDEIGIDLSEHEPQTLQSIADDNFDCIVSLSPEAHHHAVELTRVMAADVFYWPTRDITQLPQPQTRGERLDQYRAVRDELFNKVKREFAISGGPTV